MPATVQVSLGDLIEDTLDEMYRANERPAQVTVGSDALADGSDTTLTLSVGILSVTDLLETPQGEKMLVTAKSADATPIYTVARGYQTTSGLATGQPTGTVLLKNPTFDRAQVTRWLLRCIDGFMNAELPYLDIAEYTVHTTNQWAEMPADTVEVLRVRRYNEVLDDLQTLSKWDAQEVPASISANGWVLKTPKNVDNGDTIIVDVRRLYTWSATPPIEASTIDLPVAARDLPVLWAAAYALSRRQVSRTELDKIEEWNQEQAIRAGVSLRAVRDAWGEVYRRLDEAKKVHRLPRNRPYRKMR